MTYSYLVHTPDGKIGVSDNTDGDKRVEQIYKQFGNCKVEVRKHEQVFGHGLEHGKPELVTTITELFG